MNEKSKKQKQNQKKKIQRIQQTQFAVAVVAAAIASFQAKTYSANIRQYLATKATRKRKHM